MIFLLIATIFQSSAQKSAIKRLNRKENAFALGTLDFTQINQARKCNFLCLAILQSEHVKKFLFTIRPFFFLLTGQRRETRRRGRFGRPARGFGQPGRRGGSRPVVRPGQPWPVGATPDPGLGRRRLWRTGCDSSNRRTDGGRRRRCSLGPSQLAAKESCGRAGSLAQPAACSSGLATAYVSSSRSWPTASMATAPWSLRATPESEEEAEKVRVREGTSSASTSGGRSGARTCIAHGSEQGMRQQWRARSVHGGHAPPIEAIQRTGGVRRSV